MENVCAQIQFATIRFCAAEVTQGVSKEVYKKRLWLPVFFFWFPVAAYILATMYTCPVHHRSIFC